MLNRLSLMLLMTLALAACGGGKDKGRGETALPVAVAVVAPAKSGQDGLFTAALEAVRTVQIIAQEEGPLVAMPVYEGDRVNKGDVIARLDDSLLQTDLNKATATRKLAQADLKRLMTLKKQQLVSDDQLSRAQTALAVARADEEALRTRINYMTLRAPFAGVISERLAEPGDVITRYQHILTLMDNSQLRVRLPVSELFLPLLKVDDPAQVRIDALGSDQFAASITRIFPAVDKKTRQGVVEVQLKVVPEGALPGQLCRVSIRLPPSGRAVIPMQAVRHDGTALYVFRIDAEGKARRVTVRTGANLGEQVEVVEGLDMGDQVVVRGFTGLQDGASVKVVKDDVDPGT